MGNLDLETLTKRGKGKTVLMVGEVHRDSVKQATHDILTAFDPDAISVELAIGFSMKKKDLQELMEEEAPTLYLGDSAMGTALLYAKENGIPVYFNDVSPIQPEELLSSPQFSRSSTVEIELLQDFKDRIEFTFNEEEIEENGHAWIWVNKYGGWRKLLTPVFSYLDRKVHELAHIYSSPLGVTLRNEYISRHLNALEERRIVHLGGRDHHNEDHRMENLSYTVLQDLVHAEHKFYIDLQYGSEVQIERVTKTEPLKLKVPDNYDAHLSPVELS